MMRLSTEFNVLSKSNEELKGYYQILFNKLANKRLTKFEQDILLAQMLKTKNEINYQCSCTLSYSVSCKSSIDLE